MNPESREIGLCIYCENKESLTDEHVVPFGLGGNRVLKNASCNDCAKITSKFEGDLIGCSSNGDAGLLWDFRVIAGLRSRKKSTKDAKLLQLCENTISNERLDAMVPADEYVGVLTLPVFPEPSCVTGSIRNINGLPLDEWMTYVSNKDKAQQGFRYGSRFRSRSGDFPRFLAKIAYCHAIFELGYEAVQDSRLPNIILSNSTEQSKWIGCDPNNTMDSHGKRIWALEVGAYKGFMGVKIKLVPGFPDDTPEYIVIIKKLVS